MRARWAHKCLLLAGAPRRIHGRFDVKPCVIGKNQPRWPSAFDLRMSKVARKSSLDVRSAAVRVGGVLAVWAASCADAIESANAVADGLDPDPPLVRPSSVRNGGGGGGIMAASRPLDLKDSYMWSFHSI